MDNFHEISRDLIEVTTKKSPVMKIIILPTTKVLKVVGPSQLTINFSCVYTVTMDFYISNKLINR